MKAPNDLEKRHFQRIVYSAEAMLIDDDGTLPCKIVDLSLNGCLLEFKKPWFGNRRSTFILQLTLSSEVTIRMPVIYSHGQERQIGFRCQHIDIDSISNLRRLMELNLGDGALLERDLQALSGF